MKNDWTKMGALALGITLALLFAPCLPASAQTIPGCMQTDLQDLANNISAFAVTITSATPTYVPSTTIAFCDVTGDITTEDPGPNTVEFELGLPASFKMGAFCAWAAVASTATFRQEWWTAALAWDLRQPTPTAATNQSSPVIPHW